MHEQEIKTLYEIVKQVEDAYDLVSHYTSVDKKTGLKSVFDKWENNSVVRAVKEGKTSFSKESDYFKGFSPKGLPEELRKNDQRASDLEECFGTYYAVRDPVDTFGKGAIGGALIGSLTFITMTRREALRLFMLSVAGMGAVGGLIGLMDREFYHNWLKEIGKRAEYLDRAYSLAR